MVCVDFAGFNVKSDISFAHYRNTRYAEWLGVNSGCQIWKVDREIAKVGSAARASQSRTSGENLKNGAKCNVAFSHHNCIYKATRPPAQVLELLLSRLKHSLSGESLLPIFRPPLHSLQRLEKKKQM